jgi:hypothetical protein
VTFFMVAQFAAYVTRLFPGADNKLAVSGNWYHGSDFVWHGDHGDHRTGNVTTIAPSLTSSERQQTRGTFHLVL